MRSTFQIPLIVSAVLHCQLSIMGARSLVVPLSPLATAGSKRDCTTNLDNQQGQKSVRGEVPL